MSFDFLAQGGHSLSVCIAGTMFLFLSGYYVPFPFLLVPVLSWIGLERVLFGPRWSLLRSVPILPPVFSCAILVVRTPSGVRTFCLSHFFVHYGRSSPAASLVTLTLRGYLRCSASGRLLALFPVSWPLAGRFLALVGRFLALSWSFRTDVVHLLQVILAM